jgi:hypothetical protein
MCVYVTVYVYCVSQKKEQIEDDCDLERTKSDSRFTQIPT